MFHHVKDLQFNARVSAPDPRFARLLLEQFGGGNGELKAAMQYFTQAFCCRQAYPRQYDLLMDIATEEFSHLEIVGATIQMLLGPVNAELKNAVATNPVVKFADGSGQGGSQSARDALVQAALEHPSFGVQSGGGPTLTDCQGVPWSGSFVNANGELSVDLRSDIGAEARAKIVYEYLLKYTDDPLVRDSLRFLMTREIAHMQMFSAALDDVKPNFPPGVLEGDPRFTHVYFNLSDGADVRGAWNQGQGPWRQGEWQYVEDPDATVAETKGLTGFRPSGMRSDQDVRGHDQKLSEQRHTEVAQAVPSGKNQWSSYGGQEPPLRKAS